MTAQNDVPVSDSDTPPIAELDAELLNNLVYVFSDDDDLARQLSSSLEVFQHEVSAFSNVDELRGAISLRAPQALIVDIDSSAGRLAKTGLANSFLSNFPTIYVSATDNFEQRLAAVKEGAAGYFIKPVDVESLSLKIDERIADNEVSAHRVLVVDDDEAMGYFYDAVLSSADMRVKTLTDPSEVLDVMKTFKPELLLLDINMPVCTGLELAQIIRQNNHYLDIPIVFLSGDADKQLLAIETGADDFLTKPIDPEVLISAIAHRAARYRTLRKRR